MSSQKIVEHGYNGYKNFSTWVVAAFINEQDHERWDERADRLIATYQGDKAEALLLLADEMRESYSRAENIPTFGEFTHGSMLRDLLNGAFSDVDWLEVARSR